MMKMTGSILLAAAIILSLAVYARAENHSESDIEKEASEPAEIDFGDEYIRGFLFF